MIKSIENKGLYIKKNTNAVKSFKSNSIQPQTKEKPDIFQTEESLYDYKINKIHDATYFIEDIAFAKEMMKGTHKNWRKELYKKTYKKLKDNRPPLEIMYEGINSKADMNNTFNRVFIGIFSFGANEVRIQMENNDFRKAAHDKVRKIDLLISDLKDIKAQEDMAEIKSNEQFEKNKLKFYNYINEAKEKQLKPKLIDLIQRQREGRATDMPNCIMITNKNNAINEKLINWAGENINGRFVSIKKGDDILEHLEEAEENYQDTGDWTLLYVKDMDSLIDHSQSKDRIVEGMKDIMSAVAEDYHSTIIFSSTHPETLDSIALQPHRVKKINVEHIKTPKTMAIEEAKERINDPKNAKFTPIKTINDLLLIAGAENSAKLTWFFRTAHLENIDKIIKQKFSPENNKKELEIYELARKNLI